MNPDAVDPADLQEENAALRADNIDLRRKQETDALLIADLRDEVRHLKRKALLK